MKGRLTEASSGIAGLRGIGDDRKSDRVAAELESRIVSGQLEPGERLPTEGELGEILGVSRSVVRDAIGNLASRGLVVVRQGRGMNVAEPSDAAFAQALLTLLARSDLTMGDVISARAAIETRLVPLTTRSGTDADWEALNDLCDAFEEAVDSGAWELALSKHLQFHVGLLQALHEPALELFLKPMTEVILISSSPPRLTAREDWEVETHRPIVAALEQRDPDAVERAMAAHFAAFSDPRRYREFCARSFRDVYAETIEHAWPS